MIGITGRFKIKSEKREAFLDFAESLVDLSRQEAGCISYGVYEDIMAHNFFALVEEWEDQSALDAHGQTAHFQRFRQEFSGFLDGEAVFRMQEM